MKILVAHNRYKWAGGEDRVAATQVELLESRGHQVQTLFVDNAAIDGLASRLGAAVSAIYSLEGARRMRAAVEADRPDLVHVHNTFPLLSPSIFDVLRRAGIPSVATLHNFRTLCPTGTLFHRGEIVQRSVTQSAWWAVPARAYRDSLPETAALTAAVELHKRLGTWGRKPDRLVALTAHAKLVFETGGLPGERISVVPNFSRQPAPLPARDRHGALYVGRLSEEKGVRLLLDAWRDVAFPLILMGDGPLAAELRASAPPHVRFLGPQPEEVVAEAMRRASFLVLPSLWFEMFPMTVLEAFSLALPVLASDVGSLAEIVQDEENGLLFAYKDRASLIAKARRLIEDPQLCTTLGANAAREWARLYSPEAGYANLMTLYDRVRADKRSAAAS